MKVVEEFDNKLLKRKELVVENEYDSNPGFAGVAKDLADKFKSAEDVICVRRIGSRFGSRVFHIEACIYDSVDSKNKTEPKPKKK